MSHREVGRTSLTCATKSCTINLVVDGLRERGAICVQELSNAPMDRPVISQLHGVPKARCPAKAESAAIWCMSTPPAACLQGFHYRAQRHADCGHCQMIMLSARGPPRKPSGRWGQLATGEVLWLKPPLIVDAVEVRDPAKLGTMSPKPRSSVDDTAEIVAALNRRFPQIIGPHQRRHLPMPYQPQEARQRWLRVRCDVVVAAPNSSNSTPSRRGWIACGGRVWPSCVQRATDN